MITQNQVLGLYDLMRDVIHLLQNTQTKEIERYVDLIGVDVTKKFLAIFSDFDDVILKHNIDKFLTLLVKGRYLTFDEGIKVANTKELDVYWDVLNKLYEEYRFNVYTLIVLLLPFSKNGEVTNYQNNLLIKKIEDISKTQLRKDTSFITHLADMYNSDSVRKDFDIGKKYTQLRSLKFMLSGSILNDTALYNLKHNIDILASTHRFRTEIEQHLEKKIAEYNVKDSILGCRAINMLESLPDLSKEREFDILRKIVEKLMDDRQKILD